MLPCAEVLDSLPSSKWCTVTQLIAITPACNEAERLGVLAGSLASQTCRPARWVVVTNGCTDDTEAVAERLAVEYGDWVQPLHLGRTGRRSFAAKAHAVAAGIESAQSPSVKFVACIDADVVLPIDYFERVIEAMRETPDLGIAGGVYREPVGRRGRIGGHRGGHVPGPAQVMRMEVYNAIGGYRPLRFGGLDAVACFSARQAGWRTGVIEGLEYDHSRVMGTGGGVSRVKAEYLKGRQDRALGSAVSFEVPKVVRRLASSPFVIGGVARGAGYIRGAFDGDRELEPELVAFIRSEQRERVRSLLLKRSA